MIEHLDSPAQIAPVGSLIDSVGVSDGALIELAGLLSRSVSTLPDPDRNFTDLMSDQAYGIAPAIKSLCRRQEKVVGNCNPLIQTFRDYADRSLHQTVCASTGLSQPESFTAQQIVAAFNRNFKDEITAGQIQALSVPEPMKLGASPEEQLYWQSQQSKQLLEHLKQLRFSPPDVLQADSQWTTVLNEVLSSLQEPDAGDRPLSFFEKAAAYDSLLGLVADPRRSEEILRSYVQFLADSPYFKEHTGEWYSFVTKLRKQKNPRLDPGLVRRLFLHSDNSAMRAQAMYDPLWDH